MRKQSLVDNTKREEDVGSISNKEVEKEDNDIQWGKQYAIAKLINIIGTIIILDHKWSLIVGVSKINLLSTIYRCA